MKLENCIYYPVYNFTNENVACLKNLYHFENSKVLTVTGSGDQCLISMLNGARKVDLFDFNPTSYLYFVLKFYAIKELSYEEFYDFLVLRNLDNIKVYEKLESQLPVEVLKYYKYLMLKNTKKKQKEIFRNDGINLISKYNKRYYFENENTVIPYLYKYNYYKLKEILKTMELPKFYNCNIRTLKNNINDKYNIMLLSNIYNHLHISINDYTKLIKDFDIPEIQAHYDWYGFDIDVFSSDNYSINTVLPASPYEYNKSTNYVFSLKK